MATLTVFSPSYNRAHTLPRLYNSLCMQKCKDFTWLIVDDGSTDNTREVVKKWQSRDNGFQIKYIYKENGGMHTAHNVAYENIDTELNVCIDSDDMMSDNAVALILEHWNNVKNKGYAGIVALDADFSGKIIGDSFPKGMNETTLSGYYATGRTGDKKLIYKTSIINQYPPYPVFPGEKYVALAYKYRLIDQDYKLSVLNEVVCLVEYQEDGSSMNMYKQYVRNPKGFAFWRKVTMLYPTTKKRLFMDCIHYVSSSILAQNKNFIQESPRKLMTIVAIPFGIILTVYVKKRAEL